MHLTYKEIKDQYNALNKTLRHAEGFAAAAAVLAGRNGAGTLAFLGCGSSYSLARSLAAAAGIYMNRPAVALPAGDCMVHAGSYAGLLAGATVIVLSRSGSTSEVIAAVERLRAQCGAKVLSIVCTEDSPLAALSDAAVEMPWAFDESVCQTRSVSCLYAAGMLLVAALAGKAELAAGLCLAVEGGPGYMERVEGTLKAAAEGPWKDAVVLADAELAGIASEGALAFLEIARRPGAHYHVLDSRHGPMVMVGKETLAIAALTDGNRYETDLLRDVANKGAAVVAYSDLPLDGLPEGAVNITFGKTLPHAARGLPLILAAQFLAYWRAVKDGVNPDRPEGLDPWIKL